MITKYCFLLLLGFLLDQTVPYKPADEFEIVVNYKFQQKPANSNTYKFDGGDVTTNRTEGSLLPYLDLQVKLLELKEDEIRIKVVDSGNNVLLNKKVEDGYSFKISVGFIDDVKDKISPNEFTIHFFNNSKKAISCVHLIIQEDGTFLVNEIQRGKF